jgi:hypothetical protein
MITMSLGFKRKYRKAIKLKEIAMVIPDKKYKHMSNRHFFWHCKEMLLRSPIITRDKKRKCNFVKSKNHSRSCHLISELTCDVDAKNVNILEQQQWFLIAVSNP